MFLGNKDLSWEHIYVSTYQPQFNLYLHHLPTFLGPGHWETGQILFPGSFLYLEVERTLGTRLTLTATKQRKKFTGILIHRGKPKSDDDVAHFRFVKLDEFWDKRASASATAWEAKICRPYHSPDCTWYRYVTCYYSIVLISKFSEFPRKRTNQNQDKLTTSLILNQSL